MRRRLAASASLAMAAVLAAAPALAQPAGAAGRHPALAGPKDATKGRGVPPCRPSAVAATLDLGSTGGSSTSPAGAMLFRDVSTGVCTLEGAPTVAAVAAGGSAIDLYELESVPRHEVPVVLTPGGSGTMAAASITWSYWTCAAGSYALSVRFGGWSAGIRVPSATATGSTGAPCTGTGQTVYVGAVAARRG